MRVLIVEDEEPTRRLLKRRVQMLGATAVEARSAEQALAIANSEGAPAVALCDLRLPGKDGLWLAEQLQVAQPETAVVIVTGVHEFEAAMNAFQAGAVDYLCKPFTRDRLEESLTRAFVIHQSRCGQKELEQRRAQITEALAELELNATRSVEAMLAMLRSRDPISYDHTRRIAPLAVNLAMVLQIGEPQLSDIERAGLLHNLGRLAIPDELLHRDLATLSPADRARLRSYPLQGYAMLKNVPFLVAANELAVVAHERCDGSGFPYGLRADDIPLGARIIGIADAYDELVSGLGCEAVPPARALEILSTNRAAEFDPVVLDALTRLQPGLHPAECPDAGARP